MMDELGSCRAVSLAALARHAAAESGGCLGICAHDRSTAKPSAALDVMVGDGDRRVSDGGGGLIGISSKDDAPPGLNGLRLPASSAANPSLRLL